MEDKINKYLLIRNITFPNIIKMEEFRNNLDFNNKEIIGGGGSGVTYKILNKKDNNFYLLKQIFLKKWKNLAQKMRQIF